MNSLVKVAVAGVLALGASGAFAAGVAAPWTGSSTLVLVVENESTHVEYALNLGLTLDQLLPTSSLVSGASLDTSIKTGITDNISASPALKAFLAANPVSGDGWTIEGGQYPGNGNTVSGTAATNNITKLPGAAKVVFSSTQGTETPANLLNKTVAGNLNAYLNNETNAIVLSNGGLFPLESATETSAAMGSPGDDAKFGFDASNDLGPLDGTAQQLFGFTGNGTTGKLQSYVLGAASLDANGNLTFATTPVPLPAAVWLLGSGLLGLFGVSRRRNTAV
jgi:hypothetical protein